MTNTLKGHGFRRYITEDGLTFDIEISQASNLNATAHLYIQDNELLYKKYFDFNDLTRKNIENMIAIASESALRDIKELALPIEIVCEGSHVIGYTMPYYRGRTLFEFLGNAALPYRMKLFCFVQLAKVITRLPDNIFIGDLHMKNVIVGDDGGIHLIDIDGYSVRGLNLISCPAFPLIKMDERLHREKYFSDGVLSVSRETDILCFYDAFLYFLMGNIYFSMYSQKCFSDYLLYLEHVLFPKAIIEDIKVLFTEEPNRISVAAFDEIEPVKGNLFSFRAYSDSKRSGC